MKRGIASVVLIIVAVVLGLGALFVISESSNPTGYAGSPTGRITAFVPSEEYVSCSPENNNAECTPPETCQYYEEYAGYYCGEDECDSNADCANQVECGESQLALCEFPDSSNSDCECESPCEVADECDPGPEDGKLQCGGVVGGSPVAGICDPVDPDGENGACRCKEPCPEGASCSTFGVLSHTFVNPCGPNGHCEPTGGEDGTLFGQCVCTAKGCEFTDDDDKDQCPGTVKCDEGASCTKNSQCGGPGVGACTDGACDCDCVSWAPCQQGNEDEGCGVVGDCITGPDGTFECMCANDFGCSFGQCEPGVTPCDDSEDCFGGSCQTTDSLGVCQNCGVECEFFCADGDCPEPETQADCDEVGEALGGADCALDDSCDCFVPNEICNSGCFEVNGALWCPD